MASQQWSVFVGATVGQQSLPVGARHRIGEQQLVLVMRVEKLYEDVRSLRTVNLASRSAELTI
jgi:hypothetical protein